MSNLWEISVCISNCSFQTGSNCFKNQVLKLLKLLKMKWVLCDQGNFRPQSFIDRTCQPTVEPETSLGVQASKPVHQCLFSRIAWQRKRATDHFLNRFGKAEAESKSHLSRKKHPRHSKTSSNSWCFFPHIFRTLHIHILDPPHRRLRWWPMRQAHRKVRKHRTVAATFGHGMATAGPPVAHQEGAVAGHLFFCRICSII